MDARELRPRLWYWTALHPDWRPEQGGPDGWEQEVGSYAYVAPDERTLVLFDPLVPEEGEAEFWHALDTDVEHHGPPHVLITVYFHARSAAQVLARYDGARVWAYAPARDELAKWTPVTDVFAVGDALPAAVEALPVGGEDNEVAFRLPEHEAVVFGDALAAAPGAPVRVWVGDGDSLRALLERPLSLLLLTHGEPVLEGGSEALARALEG